MSVNEFDKSFRDKLHGHSSPVPEDMWQRIEQQKDKKRRRFLLLWFFALTGAMLITSVYLIDYYKEDNAKSIPAINKANNNANNGKAPVLKDSSGLFKNRQNAFAQQEKLVDDLQRKQQAIHHLYENDKTIVATFINKEEASNNISGKNDKHNSFDITDTIRNLKTSIAEDKTVIIKKKIKSNTGNAEQDSLDEKDTEDAGENKFFIEPYISPGIMWNIATANSADNNTGNYINHVNKSEHPSISFSAGVRIGQKISKHIALKAGFEYMQGNTKYNYISYDSTSEKITNRYKSLSIPILINYEAGNNNFRIAAGGGIVVNLYSWYKGSMIDTVLMQTPLASFYKSNTGLSLYGSLSLIMPLNDTYEMFAEPHIQYNLSNMTKKNAPFKRRLFYGGISLGVRYNF